MRLIKADGTIQELDLPHELHARVKQIQTLLGGYMESVILPCGQHMLCDEDGKSKGLPVNQVATTLAAIPGDYIVGDVIVAIQEELDG